MNELINLGRGQFVKVTMLKGERGSNIATVTKTATSGLVDTYTITLTDGSTTTFDVTNGSSIASITKTSTQGLVDTYTVTLTDGTTAGTFTVTNATGTIDPNFSTSSENPLQNKTTTNIIAGVENGATASKTYYENDVILRGDSLYKVTDTIAQGGTIADGVNITETTLGELIAQLSQQLTELERRGAMPILDYANPLHTFTTANESWTATEDCYIILTSIVPNTNTDAFISIDGTGCLWGSRFLGLSGFTGALHVKSGSVITTNSDWNASRALALKVV